MTLFRKNLKFVALVLFSATLVSCSSAQKSKSPLTKAERAKMLIEVANAAVIEGDPTGALQQLAEAEQLAPESPDLHHVKAIAYYAKKDLNTAIASARRSTELKPDSSAALNTLGKLLMDAGKEREAEAPLLKAANDALFREAWKANTNLGILYYRQGKFESARKHLTKAGEEFAGGACIAHYYLGHLELKAGKFGSAAREYDRATQQACASFADAHLAMGIAFVRGKQYDKARKKFLDVKQNFPDTQVARKATEHLQYLP